jgi:hypothetical protein
MSTNVGSLPELIAPILGHLRNDTCTLRSTALVSSIWIKPSREYLFRCFTIPSSQNDDVDPELYKPTNAALLATSRLVWLILHPKFATYITELEVHTRIMGAHFSIGSPASSTFMLLMNCVVATKGRIFPNLQVLRVIDEGNRTGYQPWLFDLVSHLPLLRALDLQIHSRMTTQFFSIHSFPIINVRELFVMSRDSSSTQTFLMMLGLKQKDKNPVEVIVLTFVHDITDPGLIHSVSHLAFFGRLKEAHLLIRLDRGANRGIGVPPSWRYPPGTTNLDDQHRCRFVRH